MKTLRRISNIRRLCSNRHICKWRSDIDPNWKPMVWNETLNVGLKITVDKKDRQSKRLRNMV